MMALREGQRVRLLAHLDGAKAGARGTVIEVSQGGAVVEVMIQDPVTAKVSGSPEEFAVMIPLAELGLPIDHLTLSDSTLAYSDQPILEPDPISVGKTLTGATASEVHIVAHRTDNRWVTEHTKVLKHEHRGVEIDQDTLQVLL